MGDPSAKQFDFNFEKLEAWRKAVDFSTAIYHVTRHFPDEERFGLTSQMRRASVSIASNLAEGASRSSRADFARFVEISAGSLFEVITQAELARRESFISAAELTDLRSRAAELTKILSGLRRSLLSPKAGD